MGCATHSKKKQYGISTRKNDYQINFHLTINIQLYLETRSINSNLLKLE